MLKDSLYYTHASVYVFPEMKLRGLVAIFTFMFHEAAQFWEYLFLIFGTVFFQ